MPPHSPSRSPSTTSRPSKRPRNNNATPSLLNFFSPGAVATTASPSPSKKTKEETDLEWAIAESIKEQERYEREKGVGGSTSREIKVELRDDDDDEVTAVEQAPTEAPVMEAPSIVKEEPAPTAAIVKDIPPAVKQEEGPTAPAPPALPPCEPLPAPPATSSSSRNAFSLLMSNSNVIQPTSHDVSSSTTPRTSYLSTMPYASTSADLDPLLTPSTLLKMWSHSDAVEAKNRSLRGTRTPRGVPFYKVLTGMPLAVDAFRFGSIQGCVAYFLSHAHSDHYAGLSPSWNGGPIYCTHTTANLIASSLRVPEAFLHPLPLDEEHEIPNSGGVHVTLLAANHCPGSCVFLFRGPRSAYILPPPPPSLGVPPPAPLPFIDPKTGKEKEWLYLHCGDFRASPYLLDHPRIKNSHLDIVYLDTTYLNPRYCFPAQEEVVRECGELCYAALKDDEERRQADAQRRKWEREGIREEDTGWRNIKGVKEERQEEMRRRYEGERRGMQGWLGKIDPEEDAKPAMKPQLGTLAKGLFRYDDDGDDDEEADLDEERAWLDAHDLDDEKHELREDEEEDEDGDGDDEPAVEEASEATGPSAVKSEAGVATGTKPVKSEPADLDALADDDNLAAAFAQDDEDVSMDDKSTIPAPPHALSTLGNPTAPSNGRLLVVVGTYSIGKEKIALSCALRLGTRIFCCDTRKYRIFSQMEDEPLLHSLITRDPSKAQVHVTNLFALNYESLTSHLKALREHHGCDFSRVIAFRPTGWSYRPKAGDNTVDPNLTQLITRNYNTSPTAYSYKTFGTTRDSTPTVKIYNVPYSEHSSFLELTCFMVGLGCQAGWSRVVPTVNVGNSRSRKKMEDWIKKWKEEAVRRKKRGVQGVEGMARAREYF